MLNALSEIGSVSLTIPVEVQQKDLEFRKTLLI